MFSKINSIYLRGMEGRMMAVEADVSDGLPGLILVGYLASEVREGETGCGRRSKISDFPCRPKDHDQPVPGRF